MRPRARSQGCGQESVVDMVQGAISGSYPGQGGDEL